MDFHAYQLHCLGVPPKINSRSDVSIKAIEKKRCIANPAEAFCFSSLLVSCFTVTLKGSTVELLLLIFPVRAFAEKKSIAQNKTIFEHAVIRSRATVRHTSFEQHAEASSGACTPPTPIKQTPAFFPRGEYGNHK